MCRDCEGAERFFKRLPARSERSLRRPVLRITICVDLVTTGAEEGGGEQLGDSREERGGEVHGRGHCEAELASRGL